MAHKFEEKNMNKLDNPRRREILPPKETLLKLGLSKGDTVADIGCGIGYFTFPAAEIVDVDGKVYALDTSKKMLDEVRKNITEKDINNIEAVKTAKNSFMIKDGIITFALIVNVLHEIDEKESFADEVIRIIKDEGKIVIIEWIKKQTDFGPAIDHRIDEEEVKKLLIEKDFKNVECQYIGEYFYVITANK